MIHPLATGAEEGLRDDEEGSFSIKTDRHRSLLLKNKAISFTLSSRLSNLLTFLGLH